MAEEAVPQIPSSFRLNIETGEHDDGLSAFAPVRPRLFGIAYRMLGSAAEAEDIVQDVWLRWQSTNAEEQVISHASGRWAACWCPLLSGSTGQPFYARYAAK